jgi:hypothetical protein
MDFEYRRAIREARGVCNRCGKQPPKQDALACEACLAREYAGVRRRRAAKKAGPKMEESPTIRPAGF